MQFKLAASSSTASHQRFVGSLARSGDDRRPPASRLAGCCGRRCWAIGMVAGECPPARARRWTTERAPNEVEEVLFSNQNRPPSWSPRNHLTAAKPMALGDTPTTTGAPGWLVEVRMGVSRFAPPVT